MPKVQQQGDGAALVVGRAIRTTALPELGLTLDGLDDLEETLAALRATYGGAKGATAAASLELCPHFGVIWPSAVGLAQYLAETFRDTPPDRVLELGCGLAVPSMVMCRLGAREVVASDRHPLVKVFLERNAARNGIDRLRYVPCDWRRLGGDEAQAITELGKFPLIIGADLLYESWQPGYLAMALATLLDSRGKAIIADPGRRHLAAFQAQALAQGLRVARLPVRRVRLGKSGAEVRMLELKVSHEW